MANLTAEQKARKARRFPILGTVVLGILVLIQLFLIVVAIAFDPQPQDVIEKYEVTVEPKADGSLDIEYRFEWRALDEYEPLTWVEIGIANHDYTVYNVKSENISHINQYSYEDYVAAEVYFKESYNGGEKVDFYFKINQKSMLCKGSFYEFIPGWFGSTQIENYIFRWKLSDDIVYIDADRTENGYAIWEGALDFGEFRRMFVQYDSSAFNNANTVKYTEFDESLPSNELFESKIGAIVIMIILVLVIAVFELRFIDSIVSYYRGRGFIGDEKGRPMHRYGRYNRLYTSRRGGSGFSGGGCACACACACAGGGRAGCSQKNTYYHDKTEAKKSTEITTGQNAG